MYGKEDGEIGGTFSPTLLVLVEDKQHKYGSCLHSTKAWCVGKEGNTTNVCLPR
jgi:hypothetical protein